MIKMLGVLFSTPVWPIAPKHFYLTSQEPEFLHIRESCQGHDKKTYYAQPLRQPRFPRGWIFLWISSSIKFYIREWKEEFFTSFLFYTQTHRKKSLMRPFFFLFFFFPFGVVMGELRFAGMRLLLLRRENVYENHDKKVGLRVRC